MKTIEIRIPELGKREGTLAWVAEKLEDYTSKLELHPTKLGVRVKVSENKTFPVAWIYAGIQDNPHIIYYKNVAHLHAQNGEYEEGLFSTPLTPAAEQKTNEWLQEIAEQLYERFTEDK